MESHEDVWHCRKERGVFYSCWLLRAIRLVQYPLEQDAALRKQAATPVTCIPGKDCQEKWQRATEWVVTNSEYGMKKITPDVIQSGDAVFNEDKPVIREPQYTVVKYTNSAHQVVIDFKTVCDDHYLCSSLGYMYRANFVTFVMGGS